tara:strand:- start:3624 stop:5303 length:1680 start_codon:yes stop_codon:yes gene_type:complete
LRLYHSKQLELKSKPSFIDFHQQDEKPKHLGPNEFWVETKNDSIIIDSHNKTFSIPSGSLGRWLDSWSGCQKPPTTSASKLHRAIRRFATTIVDAKLVATGKNQALTTFLGREETRELERAWRSPHMLPRVVLGLKDFSEYETCQLIIHERGRANAESWGCSNQKDLAFNKTSAKNFTKIFNYVRKSKSKLFDQSSAMLEDIQVVGNFLAKEFSFQNHSALLFLSRNGFLPPTQEELTSFNSLCDMIAPYLDRLLAKERAGERLGQLIMLMENLPLPIELIDPSGNVIFTNTRFKSSEDMPTRNQSTFPLNAGYNIRISEDTDQSFDIDHHRRVSLLGELLNTLQHELNNPLFGLHLGSLDMASEFEGEFAQLFSDISSNSTRCQTIIKNFSNLYSSSKSDSKIVLNDFINEVFILTKSEIRGINKSVEFLGFSDVNSCTLSVNPVSLSQILFNLIINAGQAIKNQSGGDTAKLREGKITLRVINKDSKIRFELIDNGPGLSPAFINNALKPFFTTKPQGTGLGLTISRGLLESIGSNLEIGNNQSDGGAFFAFELPLL